MFVPDKQNEQHSNTSAMKRKLIISRLISYTSFVLALLTIFPSPNAHADMAGFHTLCTFAPVSTIYLLGIGLFYRDRAHRILAWMERQALKNLAANSKVAA